jgi:hypothetical protein
MSDEQLIGQIARYEASSANNAYALGLCLRELSQPKRYRDELATFSEDELKKLGGPAKSHALIRLAKRQGANPDPRFLSPNARVAGVAVSKASVRDINRASSGQESSNATTGHSKAAKKISGQLGAELGRLGIAHRMRLHWHPDSSSSSCSNAIGSSRNGWRAHVNTS